MKLKNTPWKESYNKPRQCIKRKRHHFADKGLYSQGYDLSVVMYGCESWTIKKNEHRRIDAFELWCWRRLLRVPWTARRSNPSILKEINPEYSLEGLMLKLKLQYFGYLMRRSDSLEKTLILGKIEGRKRRGRQRKRWLDGIIDSMDMSLSKFREMVKAGKPVCCSPWGCKELDMIEQLSNSKVLCILSHPYLFLLLFYCEPLWNLHEASFTLNNLLNTSIRNVFSMLIRNAFSMLQRNTVFPVILRTWTLMCHSETFIYQQT